MLAARMMSAVKSGISARWWRLNVRSIANSTNTFCRELEFRPTPGTHYQPGGGSAFSSSTNPSYPVSQAFDSNTSDYWNVVTPASLPVTLGYEYASAIKPVEVYINQTGYPSEQFGSFDVQYSTDGTNWWTLQSFNSPVYSSGIFTGKIQ